MSRKRKNHSAAFKGKVALAAVRGDETVAQLAVRYDVHPTMIHTWKRALLDNVAGVFERGTSRTEKSNDALVGELYKHIGQLKVERDFLSRKSGF